ncbi:hypothetical protein ASPZODRAFT_154890 [Penicilliopsis zonata CBS 506.65]|uniref:Zinc finger C2H2 LYAR-type domain-containing protein n=1 Tax=Penicilliopsis zonata CBS 506.65 TaxID=1073090 RepID=A0A1L9S6Y9_9EURO|nr:hypothetical protein ASPZODRAFT_154890 [Penicilliopsis zonata CBS 506.65]OJJ42908.1 hypothetical protein ASPZODRAFT_154890 [Penicilliopsis zonata CBS 506.65]
MVSFSCEACGDVLTKKKLDPHRNQCRGASFTCIDCMVHFQGTHYRAHTSCMSEEQKYQGALYKEKPPKGQRNGKNNNSKQNANRQPRVEDVPDESSNPTRAPVLPPAPSPPEGNTQPAATAAAPTKDNSFNVFDYLVNEKTPNASRVSLGGSVEQMQMVDHAPSLFQASAALTRVDSGIDDEDKDYDVAYEENGFSYGAGPVKPSLFSKEVSNVSTEFMTPAPKKSKKKDRSRKDKQDSPEPGVSGTTSDKKRKRGHADDAEMNHEDDTQMMDAPSSVLNHAGTPHLNHSGLTGGLDRMLRSPSFDEDYEDGNHRENRDRRRFQEPSSPIKRTRRNEKKHSTNDGLGISMKSRAERVVSSMFGGGSVVSGSSSGGGSEPVALVRTRRGSSDSDQHLEVRKPKKSHKVRGTGNGQAAAADSRPTSKRKPSAQVDVERPSRRQKQVLETASRDSDSALHGDGRQMVMYHPASASEVALQRQFAAHFFSLVTKGPESTRGLSMNKVLKRFHRELSAGPDGEPDAHLVDYERERGRGHGRGGDREDRDRWYDDEKELWRALRLKRNERGEIVLFM